MYNFHPEGKNREPVAFTSVSVSASVDRSEAIPNRSFFFSVSRAMASNGAAGGAVVTSAERTEGHEAMDEDVIPLPSITVGHGTFVEDTGDVRRHRSEDKHHMSWTIHTGILLMMSRRAGGRRTACLKS